LATQSSVSAASRLEPSHTRFFLTKMPSGRRLCVASSSVASAVAGGGNAGDLAGVVPQRLPQEKVRDKKCTADVG